MIKIVKFQKNKIKENSKVNAKIIKKITLFLLISTLIISQANLFVHAENSNIEESQIDEIEELQPTVAAGFPFLDESQTIMTTNSSVYLTYGYVYYGSSYYVKTCNITTHWTNGTTSTEAVQYAYGDFYRYC